MNPKKLGGRLPVIIILAVVILAAIGIYRRHEGGKSTLADTYRRPRGDTLAVAIEMGPLTYNFRNDTAAGFDYEILRDIGRRHGVDMVFHPVGQLAEAFERLNEGDYDLLVASMPSTRTLKSYFPVTDPVYIDRQVLVQYADSTSDAYVASAAQLRGATVWLVEGSPFRTRILNMSSELGDSIHLATIPGQSAENLAMLTAKGLIPRAVVSEAAARRIAADYPGLSISTPVSLSHFQCWAVAPGDSVLLDSLNTWLAAFKTTPAFTALTQKYLQ